MINLFKWLFVFCVLFLLGCSPRTQTSFEILKQCFQETLVDKKTSAIADCYDKGLIIYSNGHQFTYDDYLKTHTKLLNPTIKNEIRYDNESILQNGNKLAVRFWLMTHMKNNPPTQMEVVLITELHNNKIYRIWELTNPNWTKS